MLEPKTKNTIVKLKKLIEKEIYDFYKPKEQLAYKYVPKKQEVITTQKLVITAVADDSDSSRVECDSGLTLNNENVSEQLDTIDAYIYKIAPFNDDFLLPEKSDGIAWKSFYWKHKEISLTKKLSKLGDKEKEFLILLRNFVDEEKYELKKFFIQEELSKIEILFHKYWSKNKIQNKQIEDFLLSVDVVDLVALGIRSKSIIF